MLEKNKSRTLVNRLIDKGFPYDSVVFANEVNSENCEVPTNYDEGLFDVAIFYEDEVSELYVIEPDGKKLENIKEFSEIEDNKEILIFEVRFENTKIKSINLISANSIKSLSDYVNMINKEVKQNRYRRFYRGHASIKYDLVPSIYRPSNRVSRITKKETAFVNYEDGDYFTKNTPPIHN